MVSSFGPVCDVAVELVPLRLAFQAREGLGGAGYKTFVSKIKLIFKQKTWNIPGAQNTSQTCFEPRAQTTKHGFVVWAPFVTWQSNWWCWCPSDSRFERGRGWDVVGRENLSDSRFK